MGNRRWEIGSAECGTGNSECGRLSASRAGWFHHGLPNPAQFVQGFGKFVDVELLVGVSAVGGDGVGGEAKLDGDFLGGFTGTEEAEDLDFVRVQERFGTGRGQAVLLAEKVSHARAALRLARSWGPSKGLKRKASTPTAKARMDNSGEGKPVISTVRTGGWSSLARAMRSSPSAPGSR
jgi:hypothetical protein